MDGTLLRRPGRRAQRQARRRNEWGDHETWHNVFRPLGADPAIFRKARFSSR
jgi:hypothetical protein